MSKDEREGGDWISTGQQKKQTQIVKRWMRNEFSGNVEGQLMNESEGSMSSR